MAGVGRRAAALATALAVVLALAYSGWKDLPHTWRLMRSQHASYVRYTTAEKERLFGTSIPMPMEQFDFWRAELRPGDRYWLQMPPEPFSTFADKRQITRAIAHLYLLPAIAAPSIDGATVVLSYDANPATLDRVFSQQVQAGQQQIYFSRLAHGG